MTTESSVLLQVCLLACCGISAVTASVVLATDLNLTPYQGRVSTCGHWALTVLDNTCVCTAGTTPGVNGCELCAANTYKAAHGNHSCSVCDPNTYAFAGATDSAHCLCAEGYYLDSGACTACPLHTYKSFIGNGPCLSCPAHTETSSTAQTALTSCQCTVGYTGANSGPCSPCALNLFKEAPGSQVCTACHANSQTLQTAATSSAQCVCNIGFTLANGECVECAADSYKDFVGNDACTLCSAYGDHSSTQGLTGSYSLCDCVCDAGYMHHGYCSYCLACEENHYCPAGTTNDPIPCPTHSHSDLLSTPGAAEECVCDGRFWKYTDGSCQPCPANYYCPGDETRHACPSNSTAPVSSNSVDDCVCDGGFEKIE
jgi:hypothetical protein